MNTFPLKVVTPDGPVFDGEAQRLVVRTTEGDMAVMARHINYVAPLGSGAAAVVDADGKRRNAICSGGILSVVEGRVNLIAADFQWQNQ